MQKQYLGEIRGEYNRAVENARAYKHGATTMLLAAVITFGIMVFAGSGLAVLIPALFIVAAIIACVITMHPNNHLTPISSKKLLLHKYGDISDDLNDLWDEWTGCDRATYYPNLARIYLNCLKDEEDICARLYKYYTVGIYSYIAGVCVFAATMITAVIT